jgi:hypothetical protein
VTEPELPFANLSTVRSNGVFDHWRRLDRSRSAGIRDLPHISVGRVLRDSTKPGHQDSPGDRPGDLVVARSKSRGGSSPSSGMSSQGKSLANQRLKRLRNLRGRFAPPTGGAILSPSCELVQVVVTASLLVHARRPISHRCQPADRSSSGPYTFRPRLPTP